MASLRTYPLHSHFPFWLGENLQHTSRQHHRSSIRKISLNKNSVLHHCNDTPPGDIPSMSLNCPRCRSLRIASANPAMKLGIIAGTLCGAARGATAALAASRASLASPHLSPLSLSLGSISGAILGGLTGALSSCTLGTQVGKQLVVVNPSRTVG